MLLDTERKREIAFGAGVLGLVILFAVAGETFLRLREGFRVDWNEMRQSVMAVDEETGLTRFVPGTGFGNIQVNHLGFTSPEVVVPKPDDTIRLVFLGDSVVLSASLAQDSRLASRVSAAVRAALPACNVDYVTIAGPSYRLSDITTLLGESAAQIEPDGVVLVTGGISDIFLAMEEGGGPVTGLNAPPGWLERNSRLFSVAHQVYMKAAIARRNVSDTGYGPIDPNDFSQTYLKMIDTLGARIGTGTGTGTGTGIGTGMGVVPVVVVENRGRERADSDRSKLARTDRVLLSHLEGMSVAGLRQLEDLQKRTLRKAAALHDWVYIDPLADVPPTRVYFRDQMHLTATGVAEITPVVASHLVDQLRAAKPAPGCLVETD